MENNKELLQYPIGRYQKPEKFTPQLKQEWIAALESLPDSLDKCIENFTEKELKTSYREGGWTIQQVIHHIGDVNMNAYIRLKLALTEDNPVIKPYLGELWAELPDYTISPANTSIALLHGLHHRWVDTLRNMKNNDWERTFYHPEQGGNIFLWQMMALYAWHGRHHMEQIRRLKEHMNW